MQICSRFTIVAYKIKSRSRTASALRINEASLAKYPSRKLFSSRLVSSRLVSSRLVSSGTALFTNYIKFRVGLLQVYYRQKAPHRCPPLHGNRRRRSVGTASQWLPYPRSTVKASKLHQLVPSYRLQYPWESVEPLYWLSTRHINL